MRRCLTFAVLALLAGCGAERIEVSAAEFGDAWPFTVERGVLVCDGKALYLEAGGTRYALNAPAYLKGHGRPYEEIERRDPARPGHLMPVAPVVQRARERCPEVALQ